MSTIRFERPGGAEAPSIHAVHAASFPTDDEARLVDLLRAAGRLAVSVVAEMEEAGGGIVGHAAFSPVTLDGAPDGLGMAPVAVLPDHRRQGLAAAIIREGLATCERSGVPFVVVLGSPDYYGRFGFRAAAELGLRDEYGGGDAFQVLVLQDGSLPDSGGLVRYAPEFATVG